MNSYDTICHIRKRNILIVVALIYYKNIYTEFIEAGCDIVAAKIFLKLIETGTYPSFYITKESSSELIYTNSSDVYSSEFGTYKDTIAEYTKSLKEINQALQGATIYKHEILEKKVVKVTYSNGVKILINYSDSEIKVGDISVPAMSYFLEK